MGRLSTHVLDLARGIPAAGVAIELWSVGDAPARIGEGSTDADGRFVIEDARIGAGVFELRFGAGAYLRAAGLAEDALPFLDEIPIRFGISDPGRPLHVPLLLSPFGYSTYRGS